MKEIIKDDFCKIDIIRVLWKYLEGSMNGGG